VTEPRRSPVSRLVHKVGAVAAGEYAAAAMGIAVVAWLAAYAVRGFPSWMGEALQVVAAAVTLVMVFAIQHSQRRTEAAIQLKLDELVRSSDADDRLAEIEADDDELERRRRHRHAERSN
jgi:low affinity Fe/Cu permease